MSIVSISDLINVASAENSDLLLIETSEGTRSINKENFLLDVYDKIENIDFKKRTEQLFNKEDSTHVKAGYYIQTSDGKVIERAINSVVLVPVSDIDFSKQLIIRFASGFIANTRNYFYTTEETFEAGAIYTQQKDGTSITLENGDVLKMISLPEGATYLAINGYNSNTDPFTFEEYCDGIMVLNGEDFSSYTEYKPYYGYIVTEEEILSDSTIEKINGAVQTNQGKSYADMYLKVDADGNVSPFSSNEMRIDSSISLLVGDNLITDDTVVTLGDGWTGTLSEGFTLSSGTNPLEIAVSTEEGNVYLVEFDTTGYGEEKYEIGFSGGYSVDPYNGSGHCYVALVSNGANIVITPLKTNFTISNISIYKVGSGAEFIISAINASTGGLPSNVSGWVNTKIGKYALESSVSGSRNVAIGEYSLRKLVSGARNISIGTYTMPVMVHGNRNIAIGADAMQYATEGYDNIAIGKAAIQYSDGHKGNVAIGSGALGSRKTVGNYNVAIGYQALKGSSNDVGDNIIGIGNTAGYRAGAGSIGIGYRANYWSSGNYNVCIGREAYVGREANTYTNSIALGYKAYAEKSNQTVIGNDNTRETKVFGDFIVKGTDGTLRKVVFNEDGTCSWTSVS